MILDYGVYAAEAERLRRAQQDNVAYNDRNLDRRIALDQAARGRTQQLQLQENDIYGRRQLAQDQFGYNFALQDQRDYNDLLGTQYRFQHEDELFEKQRAGRMAEQELANLQSQQMAMFQAGQTEQRDFRLAGLEGEAAAKEQAFRAEQAQFQADHQMALQKMVQEGQQSRDKLLQEYENGNLSERYKWEADKLAAEYQQEVRQFTDKNIADGNFIIPKEYQSQIDKLDRAEAAISGSQEISEDAKDEMILEIQKQRDDIYYRKARPRTSAEISSAFETKVGQMLQGLPPEKQKRIRPFIVPDQHGTPTLMSGFRGSDLLDEPMPQFVTEPEKRVLFGANYDKFKDAPVMRDPTTGKAAIDKGALDYEKFLWEKEHPKDGEAKDKQLTLKQWTDEFQQEYNWALSDVKAEADANEYTIPKESVSIFGNPTVEMVKPSVTQQRVEATRRAQLKMGNSYEDFLARRASQTGAQTSTTQKPKKLSPDGKYEWDGSKWIPVNK